ncbi:hypothetical protein [Pandoraea commovens]|uniref:Uncharacterized protein n=1 Tax=Pandoraea commovens TaxID=2508289 RepID=A0A5E4YJD4_9BURK|nr:hypothetical protein [Pandoraea commovens]VVE48398.1 hypothetical protein PCO31010_04552 [Pandoraea commovens]
MNEQNTSGENREIPNAVDVLQADAVAQHAPAAQHPVSKVILVVDDELDQLTKSHVRRLATDFYDTIADVNDPVFENLWTVAKAVPDLDAARWDLDEAATYLTSEAAVSAVLLSPQFVQLAQPQLTALLQPFFARAQWVAELKQVFQRAFPAPEFDLKFVSAPRPSTADVTQCAAVFLDLFLEQGDASPVAAIQDYLRQLAINAGDAVLPPLVLMSSHPELEQNKLRFSEQARISAAGLMVLPKEKLMKLEFREFGLTLAFKQLDRQKHVAHALRQFMASWLQALETAKENTARTLWNLDASAMQQIHLASISDDDPYDEHLNEFLSRELLFHVESQPQIATSVNELDRQFRAQLVDGKIENRLISPLVDVKTTRAFASHFTWFGSVLPASFMGEEGSGIGAAGSISRLLPFGSVLAQEPMSDGSRCLVHITQQCDLNAISRSKDASRTLSFVAAKASELQISSNPIVKSTDLVAKCLRVEQGEGEREYDLQINVAELVAMPLSEFIGRARADGWRVVGRLRSDITNHVVAATTNQMSRPASQKMIRPGLLKTKVFLQHVSFPGGKTALIDTDSAGTQSSAKIFSVLLDEGRHSFEDNAAIEIALWLTYHAATINLTLDADLLCAALRRGWSSLDQLPGGLRIRRRDCESLSAAYQGLERGDISQGGAQFTVIFER